MSTLVNNLLTLEELETQISAVERTLVILDADEIGPRYKPYRLKIGSPGSMTGLQLQRQIERMYPDVDVKVLSHYLSLNDLRRRGVS